MVTDPVARRASRLTEDHHSEFFDCGVPSLNDWLTKQALAQQRQGRSATRVWSDDGGTVTAYFTLLATTITEEPRRLSRLRPTGFPRNLAIPGILLGKLALDQGLHGRGKGIELLADAVASAVEAAQLLGGVVLATDARTEARSLYERFGFAGLDGSDRLYFGLLQFLKE